MKVRNQIGHYILADLDANNKVVYDERKDQTTTDKSGKVRVKHEYSFHLKMEQAEERLARDYADEMTSGTEDWHKCHREALGRLRGPAEEMGQ